MQAISRGHHPLGFTLVEIILVIVILGIVAGTFVRYLQAGNRMFDQVNGRKELLQEGRAALLRVVREIRQVRSSADVIFADTENFSFYGVDDNRYRISFSGTPGDDLMFGRGLNEQILASDVDSLAFEYVKSDGTAAVPLVSPNETDIFRVTISLRLAKMGTEVSLKTGTYLRNL